MSKSFLKEGVGMPKITSTSSVSSKRLAHKVNEKFRKWVLSADKNELTGFCRFCHEFYNLNPGLDFKFRLVDDNGNKLYAVWLTSEAWLSMKIPEGYFFGEPCGFSDGVFKTAVFVDRRRKTYF